MPRIRSIKPGLFANEQLGVLPGDVTVLFAGLWCLADREGRLEDRPQRIKGEVFRYREVNIENLLGLLQTNGFIKRYVVKDVHLIQVINFHKHQRPNKNEAPSELPPEAPRTIRRPIKNHHATNQEPTHDARIKSKERGEKEQEGEKEGVQGERAETVVPSVAPKRARRANSESADQIISRFQADPTYEGIDVHREYGKCVAWCDVNNKGQPSPQRFVNWLNRAERPMGPAEGTGENGRLGTNRGHRETTEERRIREGFEYLGSLGAGEENRPSGDGGS